MPLSRIRTPSSIYPTKKGKHKRIVVPQPEDRPIIYRRKDVVRWGGINIEPWWFVSHRRGIKRPKVGEDQLEARAVSPERVRGTLPERIVYQYLTSKLRLAAGIDFDFQSSLQGGRMELGGIVADFLFELMMIVIQVQGPTHDTFLRQRKDQEQMSALADMGYRVFEIDDDTIYNEYKLEEWMRRTFGLANGMGGSPGAYGAWESDVDITWDDIYNRVIRLQSTLYSYFGV